MSLMHISLLHGWLPPTMTALAFASLALGVAWWRRPPLHWLIVAMVAGGIVVGTSWLFDLPAHTGGRFPASFLAWAALPLFALGVAAWQWSRVGWWRRAVAFLALPLLAVFGGLQVNAHYGYLPTVGDLLGAPLPGQVAARTLERPRVHLSRTRSRHHRFARERVPPAAPPAPIRNLPSAAYTIGLVAQTAIPASVSHFSARPGFVWLPPWYFTHPDAQ